MKTKTIFKLFILFTMIVSCSRPMSKDPNDWGKEELSRWFVAGEWKSGWEVSPDESINQKEIAIQFYKNSERWEKAFEFLKTKDLVNMKLGRYELEGENLFVNIDEYTTKDEEVARFEAHKKYADIQYLVSGEEKIGLTGLKNTTEIVPYDNMKDIAFYTANEFNYRLASSATFFVFFPEDAHRPCVKIEQNSKVRKVVVKVRIN
jgi:YhcH/YjgK/YiaL family protein